MEMRIGHTVGGQIGRTSIALSQTEVSPTLSIAAREIYRGGPIECRHRDRYPRRIGLASKFKAGPLGQETECDSRCTGFVVKTKERHTRIQE